MNVDRADWEQATALRRAKTSGKVEHARTLQREALFAEQLSGDPLWDRFLEYVNAALKAADEKITALDHEWATGRASRGEELVALKMDRVRLAAVKNTLEAVLAMPVEMLQAGEAAMKFIDDLALDES